jgi:hypothetical protein
MNLLCRPVDAIGKFLEVRNYSVSGVIAGLVGIAVVNVDITIPDILEADV